jgi:MFS family permease
MFRRKPGYRWVIFGLSFTNMIAEGGITDIMPVIYLAVRDYFRWSATATAGIFSVAGVTGAIAAPIAGRLLDRLEPRYVFLLGGLLILIGFVTSSFASELWHLIILFGVVMTLGETIVSGFAISAILVPWFPRTRGRMLGLVEVGNPMGTLLLVPLAQLLVSTIGWQDTFLILGLIFLLLLVPGNFFFLRRSSEKRSVAEAPQVHTPVAMAASAQDAEDPAHIAPIAPEGNTAEDPAHEGNTMVAGSTGEEGETGYLQLHQILRSPAVWLLVPARFLGQTGRSLIAVHIVAFFAMAGYDPLLAASAIGVVGMVNLIGRPVMGALSDSLGREVTFTLVYGINILAITVMMLFGNGHSLWPIVVFVGLAGFSEGIAGMLTNAKVSDIFPARSLGTVMGILEGSLKLGFMIGPLLGGLLFDLRGNYHTAFITALALMASALVFIWAVPLTTRRSLT